MTHDMTHGSSSKPREPWTFLCLGAAKHDLGFMFDRPIRCELNSQGEFRRNDVFFAQVPPK